MIISVMTCIITALAVIFLYLGRHEIPKVNWHYRYFLHVLSISIPIALLSIWVLSIPVSSNNFTVMAFQIGLKLIAVIGYFMTGWLTLIFTGALIIRLLTISFISKPH